MRQTDNTPHAHAVSGSTARFGPFILNELSKDGWALSAVNKDDRKAVACVKKAFVKEGVSTNLMPFDRALDVVMMAIYYYNKKDNA